MKRFIAVVGLVLLVGCQAPPAEMTEAEIAQIEADVVALDQAMGSTVAAWDLEAFLGFFSENFSWTLNGEAHHSLESWIEQVTPFFSSDESLDGCEFVNRRVQVLTHEVAISTSVVNCVAPSPEGAVLVIDHTWTAVWAKEESQWKIVNVSETYRPTEAEG